jgi:hypothetical protein
VSIKARGSSNQTAKPEDDGRQTNDLAPVARQNRDSHFSPNSLNPNACDNTHIRVVTRIAFRATGHKPQGEGESK